MLNLGLQEVEKFRRIWNTLMQVWMTGYRGFLLEAIGPSVDEAELFFLFRATNCHFPSLGLELKLQKDKVFT